MASSLVHFLVGASAFLLIAAVLSIRYDVRGRWNLWLVPAGGIWGLIPDGYRVTPVFREEYRIFHDSRWADLFAFHYTIDQSVISDLYAESTIGSLVLFFCAVAVFTTINGSQSGDRSLSSEVTDRRPTTNGSNITVADTIMPMTKKRITPLEKSIVTVAVIAGIALGIVIHGAGRIEAVAIIYGRDTVLAGWTLILALSFVGSAVFALFLELVVPDRYARSPIVGSVLGLAYGIVVWLVVISVALPIWMEATLGLVRPIPYLHAPTLAGLFLFGLLVGIGYPLCKRIFEPANRRSLSSPRQ